MTEPSCITLAFGRVAEHFGVKPPSRASVPGALSELESSGLSASICVHPAARMFPAVRRIRRETGATFLNKGAFAARITKLSERAATFGQIIIATAPILYSTRESWSHCVAWLSREASVQFYDPILEIDPDLPATIVAAASLYGRIDAISTLFEPPGEIQ